MWNRLVISINNKLAFLRRMRCAPEQVLILAPHCLQAADCDKEVVKDINNCARCGKCKIADFADMGQEYGLRVVIANGGRQATAAAMEKDIRTILAVACEKELAAGILALPSKKIYAIPNIVKCSPCVNTDVHMPNVRTALERIVCYAG
ncbi:MAG: DUF116 domain-containing protein [Candidatus Sumerlaeia bacterium]